MASGRRAVALILAITAEQNRHPGLGREKIEEE